MRSIIEINYIQQAIDHIDSSIDFVFMDIDNTLIAAKDPVNVLSYAEGLEKYIRTIYGPRNNLTIKEQEQIIQQHVSEYVINMQPQLVEQSAVDLIKTLRLHNMHVIALTGRPHDTAAVSTQQLAQCGIQLSSHLFEPKEFQSNILDHPVVFQDGIISCGRNLKGRTATHFFDTVNFKPKAVMLIDDSAQYLDEMAFHLNLAGITFKGLRYGHLDEQVRQFVFSHEHVPPHLR